jgi:hypothetical protein
MAKWRFARQAMRRLKVLSNSTMQIVFEKRRQECNTLELNSSKPHRW